MNTTSNTQLRAPLLIAAIALLVFSFAYLLRSVPVALAAAEGPQVTGGSHPYLAFAGSMSGSSLTLLTVPNDRIFVLTGACTTSSSMNILEGSTMKVHNVAMRCFDSSGSPGFMVRGNGHIPFASGTDVVLSGGSGYGYSVQGYLAHP